MEPRLQVLLLGPPEATLDGQPMAGLKLRKTQALLYLLATRAGLQRRTVLTGLLWGDLPEAAASTNLRKSLCELRHALDPFLHIERETVALRRAAAVWVDHFEFVSRVEAPGGRDVAWLEAAVGLYRGDFLTGVYVHDAPDFEYWVAAEQHSAQRLGLGKGHVVGMKPPAVERTY